MQHANRESHVPHHVVQTCDELDVPTALANRARVSQPPPGLAVGFLGRHAVGHEVACPGIDVKLQFFLELVGDPICTEDIGDAREPGHGAPSDFRRASRHGRLRR
jgi:hypothetical protein